MAATDADKIITDRHSIQQELLSIVPNTLATTASFVGFLYNELISAAKDCQLVRIQPSFFRVDDITVVGGSVVTVYEEWLRNYKNRHPLPEDMVLERKTNDIDVTWCMAVNPEVPYRNPDVVYAMGQEYVVKLILKLKSRSSLLINEIRNIPALQQLDLSVFSVEVDTKADHKRYNVKQLVEMYGSYHIIITLKIGSFHFTVCEINIHDGYHSQKYNWNHEYQANKTIGLHSDPMYCTAGFPPMIASTTTTIPIQTKTMRLALVRVPNLRRFMEQQLFAFGNLLLDVPPKEKGYIALQRVVYLIRLTMEGLLHSAEDMKDMRVLLSEPAMLYTVISETHMILIERILLLNTI